MINYQCDWRHGNFCFSATNRGCHTSKVSAQNVYANCIWSIWKCMKPAHTSNRQHSLHRFIPTLFRDWMTQSSFWWSKQSPVSHKFQLCFHLSRCTCMRKMQIKSLFNFNLIKFWVKTLFDDTNLILNDIIFLALLRKSGWVIFGD